MADISQITVKAKELAEQAAVLARESEAVESQIQQASISGIDPFVFGLFVFLLACFVGYYVVWRVTPALHTPLMAVTNAISGIIVVGALIAVGPQGLGTSQIVGFIAVVLASINIFGGFIVTQRMLQMFKKKEPTGGGKHV